MSTSIQQVIDLIVAQTPGAPTAQTVDTVKTGDPSRQASGVVTTFSVTQRTVEQAVRLGANLIITHEPTFYNHFDETDWLADDPVYRAKRQLLEAHNIVIWRFHDHLHAQPPDRTFTQLLKTLGWEGYAVPGTPFFCNIPPIPLAGLLEELKRKLDRKGLRFVGDPALACRGVALLPGAPPGQVQIGLLAREGVDVLVCGEIKEWEVSEYARDALQQGRPKALVVIGHAVSEEAAMADVAAWLRARLPEINVSFLPAEDQIGWVS